MKLSIFQRRILKKSPLPSLRPPSGIRRYFQQALLLVRRESDDKAVREENLKALEKGGVVYLGAADFSDASKLASLKHSAICLSGGGIRSATFNLGILQALQSRGILDLFDSPVYRGLMEALSAAGGRL